MSLIPWRKADRRHTRHQTSVGHNHRQERSLNTKWLILLLLSLAIFYYLVLVTEVLHMTTRTPLLPKMWNRHPLDKNSMSAWVPIMNSTDFSFSSSGLIASTPETVLDSENEQAGRIENGSSNTIGIENIAASASSSLEQNQPEIVVPERHINRLKGNRRKKKGENKSETNNDNNKQSKNVPNETEIDWSKWTFEESAMQPNISNMEFYNISSDGTFNLWDNDPTLPYWMKSYFNWHKWKRKTWDLQKWKSDRWMLAQCLMDHDKRRCGGTSDRLKPIPTLLRIAYNTKRILLIRWTRPSMLEDFLMPPEGGLDWRVPPGLIHVVQNVSYGKKLTPFNMIDKYTKSGMSLVRIKYQTMTPELTYGNLIAQDLNETLSDYPLRKSMELSPQPDFDSVFHKVWRIFFTPSQPVANVIQSKLKALDLTPNQYVATHLRALYAVDTKDRPDWYIQLYTENALACATMLRPGVPIFFASDSSVATDHALKVGREKRVSSNNTIFNQQPVAEALSHGVVASVPNPNPPWHLDSMIGPVENFYDTFVDLYLMALAGCVTYGKGGYGHWALLIGGSIHCTIRQDLMGGRRYIQKPCSFQVPPHPVGNHKEIIESSHNNILMAKQQDRLDFLFLPVMKKSIDGQQDYQVS